MTIDIARAAFVQIGGLEGDVSPLAEGMSSTAWLGTVLGTDVVVRMPVTAGRRPPPRYAPRPQRSDSGSPGYGRSMTRGFPITHQRVSSRKRETAAKQVAGAYSGGDEIRARARVLGVAFALYKIDKTPTRADVIERAERML